MSDESVELQRSDAAQVPQAEEPVEDVDEESEVVPYRYSITSYGADYPVDSLVKRISSGDIVVPTFDPDASSGDEVQGFQRRFVWTKTQCDRFIESLLLGLPVPGIFLVKQRDGVLLVLDGQQRLRTLQAFYGGVLKGKEFCLVNVQDNYRNLTYRTLDAEDRRRLDDSIIHATIIRQDEPAEDQSSVYLIFERLNTGGTTLHPQEIRVALYRGQFLHLLRELNDYQSWRRLYGKKSDRLKDHELILRFFALFFWQDKYARPMKDFLNCYMGANRQCKLHDQTKLRDLFTRTTDIVLESLGDRAFRLKNALNAAVLDSVMVGVAHRLQLRPVSDTQHLHQIYLSLLETEAYRAAVEKATADEENVRTRVNLAKEKFSEVR